MWELGNQGRVGRQLSLSLGWKEVKLKHSKMLSKRVGVLFGYVNCRIKFDIFTQPKKCNCIFQETQIYGKFTSVGFLTFRQMAVLILKYCKCKKSNIRLDPKGTRYWIVKINPYQRPWVQHSYKLSDWKGTEMKFELKNKHLVIWGQFETSEKNRGFSSCGVCWWEKKYICIWRSVAALPHVCMMCNPTGQNEASKKRSTVYWTLKFSIVSCIFILEGCSLINHTRTRTHGLLCVVQEQHAGCGRLAGGGGHSQHRRHQPGKTLPCAAGDPSPALQQVQQRLWCGSAAHHHWHGHDRWEEEGCSLGGEGGGGWECGSLNHSL